MFAVFVQFLSCFLSLKSLLRQRYILSPNFLLARQILVNAYKFPYWKFWTKFQFYHIHTWRLQPHLPGRVKISEVNPSIKHNPRGSNASKILLWIPLIKISGCGCLFLPSRGSWRQPRSSCEPPPTYHPQRPESHEQSPSYSSYKNVYFRSFLRTVSPKGCMVAFDSILQRHLTPA